LLPVTGEAAGMPFWQIGRAALLTIWLQDVAMPLARGVGGRQITIRLNLPV